MFRNLYLIALLSLPAVPVFAADDRAGVIEEIVVSATRRSEQLNDVAGSVSAFTNEDIRRLGLDSLESFARSVPGLNLHQIVKNRSVMTIRGINTDVGETQLTQEPVSVYVNDMPVTQPYAALVQVDLRLYDIERIEVLRGPQGTLFGSGSLGGTVRVITAKPDPSDIAASVRVDAADTKSAGARLRYDGMVNVPLIDDVLAVRLVGYSRDEAGWVENVALNQDNSSDDSGSRVSLLWLPTENLEVNLEWLTQQSDPDAGDSWNPALGQFKRSTVLNESRKADIEQTGLTLKWDLDSLELYSATNWQETQSNWNVQLGTIPGFASGVVTNQSQLYVTDFFSQEFRANWQPNASVNVVGGLFYLTSDNNFDFDFGVPGLAEFVNTIIGVPGFITRDSFYAAAGEFEAKEQAVFADVSWALTEELGFSAGLRYSTTDSEYATQEGYGFNFGTFAPFVEPVIVNQNDESGTMWRLVGEWQPADDRLYYANLSKGFRVGQVNPYNGPSFVDPTDYVIPATYQMDETLSIEIGAKVGLLDNRAQLNLAAYRTDWSDVQVDALRGSDQTNYVANAGDAIAMGLEIELEAWASDNLRLDLSLTFQDAEIDEVDPIQSLNSGALPGDPMPGTADFMAALGVDYFWNWQAADMLASVNLQHVGESWNRFSLATATGMPNPDRAVNEAYTSVNASLAFIYEQWEATLYAENLTDNDNIILNAGMSTGNPYVTLRPRTIGARLEWFF